MSETTKHSNGISDNIASSVGDKDLNKVSEPGVAGKLILSFSVYTNGKKILSTNQGPSSISSINGIRFISMTWVILGHTYAFLFNVAGNMATFYPKQMDRWSFNAIGNALISVDSFFALSIVSFRLYYSGLLMSYLILKEMKKKKGACGINWGLFYFHRFWRVRFKRFKSLKADLITHFI
ncbi:hypothetical protein KUTeg_017969 [Tegillarca granosa]|uniref:Acyltransferase 3 domain-containing protein n=1 Tax=Tegillarca granosa TaxID=220873 RepID=A0ABQ9EGJ2_TEGGR|nr:hypothetical protein KUTeg_017969 [Tegillarca granosa]